MEKIKELQLGALDTLGSLSARIETALDQLRDEKNPFDVEAKVYFIRHLAERLEKKALEIHGAMHLVNSEPGEYHDLSCVTGGKS